MFLWNLLKHPQWDWLTFWDRVAYLISLACFLFLMSLGAQALYHHGVGH